MFDECNKIGVGLAIRYGQALFNSQFTSTADFGKALSVVLSRAGLESEDAAKLREWMQQGLKSFSSYPPPIETLLNLCFLVKSHPLSEHQRRMKHVWYALDVAYGQTYFKFWRSDNALEELMKERVWLTHFDKMKAAEIEVNQAQEAIRQCGAFRQYPPSIEQFCDAILAVRQNVPIVEEAWLSAKTAQSRDLHPLVQQARACISSHDMNMNARDRDLEHRFKSIYRGLLSGQVDVRPTIIDEPLPETKDYMDQADLSSKISQW